MSIKKIDPKELIQIKEEDVFQADPYFYKKEHDGTFSMCHITEKELEDDHWRNYVNALTIEYLKKGLLYRRINKPFQNFLI